MYVCVLRYGSPGYTFPEYSLTQYVGMCVYVCQVTHIVRQDICIYMCVCVCERERVNVCTMYVNIFGRCGLNIARQTRYIYMYIYIYIYICIHVHINIIYMYIYIYIYMWS